MALFDKLEKAVDRGSILIEETIVLVRLTQDLLRKLDPVVAELPDLAAAAKRSWIRDPRDP